MKRTLTLSLLFLLTFVGGLACGAFGVYRMTNLTRSNLGDMHIWYIANYAHYLEKTPPSPAACDPMRKWVSTDLVTSLLTAAPAAEATDIPGNRERLHRLAKEKISDEMLRCAWQGSEQIALSRDYVRCLASNNPASPELKTCLDRAATEYEAVVHVAGS